MSVLTRKDLAKRIISAAGIGLLTVVLTTIIGGFVSIPIVELFSPPKPSLAYVPYAPLGIAGIGILTLLGSYIIGSGIGGYVAGFWLARQSYPQDRQYSEATITGLLVVLLGYFCALARIDVFLVIAAVGMCSAIGGYWVGYIYDNYPGRVQLGSFVGIALLFVGLIVAIVKIVNR